MTNFEFYRDEILEITKTGEGIALKCGKLIRCNGCACDECEFSRKSPYPDCNSAVFEWLYAEHIEAPKLTKRERAFCELVGTGWIARDYDMELCYFKCEPILLKGVWSSQDGGHVSFKELNLENSFMFIRDTDADCWSVEDLLKLEVE